MQTGRERDTHRDRENREEETGMRDDGRGSKNQNRERVWQHVTAWGH